MPDGVTHLLVANLVLSAIAVFLLMRKSNGGSGIVNVSVEQSIDQSEFMPYAGGDGTAQGVECDECDPADWWKRGEKPPGEEVAEEDEE